MADATSNSNNIADSALSYASDKLTQVSDSQKVTGYSVEEIGKPFKFATMTDPQDRAYRFLATRMNVIDLYPCNYAQSYLYSADSKKSMFKYGVAYENAMKRYRKMCTEYLGTANPPSALRLFLTDDTITTDGIGTQYSENFFQKMADSLSSAAQSFTSLTSSISSSAMQEGVDSVLSDVNTNRIAESVSAGLGLSQKSQDVMGGIIDNLKQGAAIVLKGNKLSLPKIWQNSSYTPTFSVSTKLFSPYGHPSAIKEYIIKPLSMILMMGIPQSDDMVSYNRPFAVTVRSWGTSFLTLAGITAITLQRGGADSVYNIYKQPLVVNVNIEFTSLVDGVIAFSSLKDDLKIPAYEKTAYKAADQILTLNSNSQKIDGSVLPTVVPTLGGIIRSLQPVQFSGLTYGYNETQSTRDDVMVGGNGTLGSSTLTGLASGFFSAFNAAYGYAASSASSQSGFGTSLFEGVTSTLNTTAAVAGVLVNNANKVVNTATSLANLVSGGAYGSTPFARNVRKAQSEALQAKATLRQTAIAANVLRGNIATATKIFGSMLNYPT